MRITLKKRSPRPVTAPATAVSTSGTDIVNDRKNSALPVDIDEPLLTPEQEKFYRSLTAENGFSMEAALERLEKRKAAKSTS